MSRLNLLIINKHNHESKTTDYIARCFFFLQNNRRNLVKQRNRPPFPCHSPRCPPWRSLSPCFPPSLRSPSLLAAVQQPVGIMSLLKRGVFVGWGALAAAPFGRGSLAAAATARSCLALFNAALKKEYHENKIKRT